MPYDPSPKVTVIVPTYERAHKVARAVLSILAQTYRPLEVVVIDDASTDATASVICGLAAGSGDVEVRYLRHDQNQGGAAARNRGVAAATGQLVSFLDSDDTWLPRKTEIQVAAWRAASNQARSVVYCAAETYEGWKSEVRPHRPMAPGTTIGDYLFVEGGFVQTSCLLMPRDLAGQAPFDDALRAHQDIQFVLALEAAGAEFVYVAEPLVRYSTAPDEGRVSSDRSSNRSELFLERHGHHLSPRARLGFEARLLALRWSRSGFKRRGVATLLRAARQGVLPLAELAWLLPRALVSEGAEMALRKLIDSVKRGNRADGIAG